MGVKIILLALLMVLGFAVDTCDLKHQIGCLDDLNVAYPVCKKAAEEKGKDVPVDIDCLKYFSSLTEDCWPCICFVANLEKWKIKGCD